ncbi:MAG: hypothetical protein ACRD1R_12380, partial [Acidobacteriota bacterium]
GSAIEIIGNQGRLFTPFKRMKDNCTQAIFGPYDQTYDSTWSSDDTSVITTDQTGWLNCVGAGSTGIQAGWQETVAYDAACVAIVVAIAVGAGAEVFNIQIGGSGESEPGEGTDPPSLPLTVQMGRTPSSPVNVVLRAEVRELASGGHSHESPTAERPVPRLKKGTTWSDVQTFTVSSSSFATEFRPSMGNNNTARGIAGQYIVKADFQGQTAVDTHDIDVKYDLQELGAGSTYYQRRVDSRHNNGDYHYGTSSLHSAIVAAADKFWNDWGKDQDPQEKMVVNDQSLLWGGLFEVPNATVWTADPGHVSHRAGKNVDLPFRVFRDGAEVAISQKGKDILESAVMQNCSSFIDEGDHFHCTKN